MTLAKHVVSAAGPSESKWVQVSPSESKWIQVSPSESKWVPVNPSESKWTPVSPSESKWIQVNPSDSNWVQVNPSESKWAKVNPSESKLYQADASKTNRDSSPLPQSSYPALVGLIGVLVKLIYGGVYFVSVSYLSKIRRPRKCFPFQKKYLSY